MSKPSQSVLVNHHADWFQSQQSSELCTAFLSFSVNTHYPSTCEVTTSSKSKWLSINPHIHTHAQSHFSQVHYLQKTCKNLSKIQLPGEVIFHVEVAKCTHS